MEKKKSIQDVIVQNTSYDSMLMDFIKEVVSNYYKVDFDKFMSTNRRREYVKARQVCMYLISKNSKISQKTIGKAFYKDHATVIHSKKTISNYLDWDEELRREIDDLQKVITYKARAIVNNFSLEKDFYYIDMNDFTSVKPNKNQAIILVGYSDKETEEFIKHNHILTQPRNHTRKGMYILEKNEDEENTNQGQSVL